MSSQVFGETQNYMRRNSVRDVIVAKAINNGCNPYCKSTDADAKRVTDEMRAKVKNIIVPEIKAVASKKNAIVREASGTRRGDEHKAHREIVHIENFELVKRKSEGISMGMLVSFMIVAMVLTMIVFSGSLINEEARRYSELVDTLEVLKEEDKALMVALEDKHELLSVADVAVNELGMVLANTNSTELLSLSEGDTVELYNEGEKTSFAVNLLNTFGDKIGDFLEYLD